MDIISGSILLSVQISIILYYRKKKEKKKKKKKETFQYLFRSVLRYFSENSLISFQVGITLFFGKQSYICSGRYYVIFRQTDLYLFRSVLRYFRQTVLYLFRSVLCYFQEIFLYLLRSVLCYISGNVLMAVQVGTMLNFKKLSNIWSCRYYVIFQETVSYLFRSVLCYIAGNFLIYVQASIMV